MEDLKEKILEQLAGTRAKPFDILVAEVAEETKYNEADVRAACKELWASEEIEQYNLCVEETPITDDTIFRLV